MNCTRPRSYWNVSPSPLRWSLKTIFTPRFRKASSCKRLWSDVVVELEVAEDLGVGLEGGLGAGAVGLAHAAHRAGRHAAFVFLLIDVAVAADFDLAPFGEEVHDLDADAVQAAGGLVGLLVELAAELELGHHAFERGDAHVRMDFDGNAAAVVGHGDRAVEVDGHGAIGSVSFDHPDPSIFLVMHSASDTPGVSSLDFAIFPPRILAAADTFRPPWFHRNVASEFMGLVHGAYDAKAEGFVPGGASLHNSMSGARARRRDLREGEPRRPRSPHVIENTMAFMFETRAVWRPTRQALEAAELQDDYFRCWQGLKKHFDPSRP